jgi:hypothetical protein
MIEVHKRICGPQAVSQFFPTDDFPGRLKEKREYLEGLFLQLKPGTVPSKFSSPQVYFEKAKASKMRSVHSRHESSPLTRSLALSYAFTPDRHAP